MIPMSPAKRLLGAIAVAIVFAGAAHARSSDRKAPMNIEASTQQCSLGASMTCTLTGNVIITQGTLKVNAGRAVISQANGRPQRGQLSGGVTVSQLLDDGTPMSSKSANADYDFINEVITLTGNVTITQPRGSMSGSRIVYNTKSGQVNSGGDGTRVKMVIMPKG